MFIPTRRISEPRECTKEERREFQEWRVKRKLQNDREYRQGLLRYVAYIIIFVVLGTVARHYVLESAATHSEKKIATVSITCPQCLYVPSGLQRVRFEVVTKNTKVTWPTNKYLSYLNRTCAHWYWGQGKRECRWRLGEIQKGMSAVNSIIDPVYGQGGSLTPTQLAYVTFASKRTMELLREYETIYSKTREEFFREHSSGRI